MSGVKDVDLMIMAKLDDKTLLNLGQTNKYLNSLFNKEIFWFNRCREKFGVTNYNENEYENWKTCYFTTMKAIKPYINEPWKFMKSENFYWCVNKDPVDVNINSIISKYLNFGNEIVLSFKYQNKYISRKYNTNTYFTFRDILSLIYEFYSEPSDEYPRRIYDVIDVIDGNEEELDYVDFVRLVKYHENSYKVIVYSCGY